MIPHGNVSFYFDVDKLVEKISIKKPDNVEINIPKYELYKTMVEVVISPIEEDTADDDVLAKLKNTVFKSSPFDFKIAFNTLLNEEIIKVI